MKIIFTLTTLVLLSACTHSGCDPTFIQHRSKGALVMLDGGLEHTFAETLEKDYRYTDDPDGQWRCNRPLTLDERILENIEKMSRLPEGVY